MFFVVNMRNILLTAVGIAVTLALTLHNFARSGCRSHTGFASVRWRDHHVAIAPNWHSSPRVAVKWPLRATKFYLLQHDASNVGYPLQLDLPDGVTVNYWINNRSVKFERYREAVGYREFAPMIELRDTGAQWTDSTRLIKLN